MIRQGKRGVWCAHGGNLTMRTLNGKLYLVSSAYGMDSTLTWMEPCYFYTHGNDAAAQDDWTGG